MKRETYLQNMMYCGRSSRRCERNIEAIGKVQKVGMVLNVNYAECEKADQRDTESILLFLGAAGR
jgi:ethanolamine ammonia-lyase large subunit